MRTAGRSCLCLVAAAAAATCAACNKSGGGSAPSPAASAPPSGDHPAAPAAAPALAHHVVDPHALPAPDLRQGKSDNGPRVVDRPAGASLHLPPGFVATIWSAGEWKRPRWIAVAPNGDAFVADSEAGTLYVLRDANADGVVDARFTFATGLTQPFGLAFAPGWLYVGDTDAVVRFPYQPGQTQAAGAPQKVTDLPGGGYNQHWTRDVAFSPDGKQLFVTVGSKTNDDDEPAPRASILVMSPDGSGRRTFASGTRNPVGIAFDPTTKALWAAVEERDLLGDDLVPDYVTEVKEGGFYGWPWAYMGKHEDPRHAGERHDLVPKTLDPDVPIQAHSAVLGLRFYDGAQFPPEYRGDAFVALHGSWNRSKRTGYSVVRVRMKDGHAIGGYDDFCTGWLLDENGREVWGRPVGLAVDRTGALLVVDDGANVVWRIAYATAR